MTADRAKAAGRAASLLTTWSRTVIRFRWLAILLSLLGTAFFASYLPRLVLDNSIEGILHAEDPESIRYRSFRDHFGRDDRIIVGVEAGDPFSAPFLERFRLLHLALEAEVPYVDEVTSLFNARSTRGDGDQLIVGELLEGWLEEWPQDAPSKLADLRQRVLSNPLYVDNLISADARLTTILIEPLMHPPAAVDIDPLTAFDVDTHDGETAPRRPLDAAQTSELVRAVHGVAARFESADFPIHIGGALAITNHIDRTMEADIGPLLGLCLLIMIALLTLLFRRLSGALLPILLVILSVVSTLGIMVMLGIPGSTVTQFLPILLAAVGICDAVHIQTIAYQRFAAGDPKDEAIVHAIVHSGPAVVLTSATTAAGMASFSVASMAPVANLGIIAPIGVGVALLYALALLPAVLSVLPMTAGMGRTSWLGDRITQLIVSVGRRSAANPVRVLVFTGAIVAFFASAIPAVRFSHLPTDWFPERDTMRTSTLLLDQRLRGTMSLEVVLDTGRSNGLHDPLTLRSIELAAQRVEALRDGPLFVGKSTSIVDIVKEIHQALDGNHLESRRLPAERELIAQELLLFENSGVDDLEEFVDRSFQTARLSLRVPFADAMLYGPFIERLQLEVGGVVGDGVEISLTGFMHILASVFDAMITSMTRSYVVALLIITPTMILFLRDIRLGLLSMVPNLVPVVVILGLMGWSGIAINATTMLVGAMVIGLAVDDTIHFMHKFRMHRAELGSTDQAVRATLESTGVALVFTSLVIAGGFSVFLFATMSSSQHFGLLAATGACVALAADVVLGPALLALAWGSERARSASELPRADLL